MSSHRARSQRSKTEKGVAGIANVGVGRGKAVVGKTNNQ